MADVDHARVMRRGAFVIWAPPGKGRRSIVLGRALGIGTVAFLSERWRVGLRGDPLKYPRQLARTIGLLVRQRPPVVLVQSPPSIAVWTVAIWGLLTRTPFLVDAHSDAFQRARWTRPRWLNRLVARRALAWLVTDEHWARRLEADGARAIVIPDIPDEQESADRSAIDLGPGFHVMVVNTWSSDEPLREVVAAASELPRVTFHVTGRADQRVATLGSLPGNVRFTDFLPDAAYYDLMAAAHAVLCLTTRNHTMQRGACEALSLARPIVTSDWPLLRAYFRQGTAHADNTAGGIRTAVRDIMENYEAYSAEVTELRAQRRREWATNRAELLALIREGRN